MEELNFLGIGPRMAIVLLPWLVGSIVLSSIQISFFRYTAGYSGVILTVGIILMAAALIFYFSTVRALLKGLKETRLMITGPYRYTQNPLYAAIILFIIPALSLILNSWLVLTTSFIGYILFKLFIKHEYEELEKFFGEDYLKYKSRTSEFFPQPPRK
jgi:protein-S-isoprenylcysteine O-methyltransferase Ste14